MFTQVRIKETDTAKLERKTPQDTEPRRKTRAEVRAMTSSWQSETGHLALRWTEVGRRD